MSARMSAPSFVRKFESLEIQNNTSGARNINKTDLDECMRAYFDSCCPTVSVRSAIEGLYARFDETRSKFVGLRCFAKYLAAFLHKYDCHDVTVLSGIVMLCELFNWCHFRSIGGLGQQPERWMTVAQRLSSQSAILGDRSSETSDFSVMYYSELTFFAVQDGRYDLLRVLVKYGLCALPALEEKIINDLLSTLSFWWLLESALCRDQNSFNSYLNPVRFVEKCKAGDNKLNPRTFIVLWAVDVVVSHLTRMNERLRDRSVTEEIVLMKRKCLDLLVESTSQPFVAESDVRQFFHYIFDYPETDAFLEGVCASFRTLFPQSRERLQPRSLLDLSRCRVRDCIRKSSSNTTLPQQVSKLPIPVSLENFILFNN